MDEEDYREIFEHFDVATAFFSIILENSYTIKDIVIENYNERYLAFEKSIGENESVLHQSCFALNANHDPRWIYYFYQAAVKRQHVHGELRDRVNDRWIEFSGGPATKQNTCWMTFIDHTKYKKENERLLKLSYMDLLTNVKNRNAYQQAIQQLKKLHQPVGVVFTDINGLKEINDSYGHQSGDDYLRRAAEYMCSLVGDSLPYRVGGDEFVLLMVDRSREETQQVLERLRMYTDISLSLGAHWVADSALLDETVAQADYDMYNMKKFYYRTHERRHVI